MNGDPLSAFLGGEPSSSSRRRRRLLLLPPPSFPPAAAEELSNFDAMFSGVSLRSLLLDNPVSSSSPSPFSSSSSYSSSPPPSSPLWSPLPSPVSPFSPSPEQHQHLSFRYSPSPLKMPKQEPPHCFPDFAPASSPFDSLSLADDSTLCFPLHRLSDLLRSLETLQPQPPQPPPAAAAAAAAAAPGPARKRSPADPERTKRAREKRRKIGDCMRQLHELVMPQVERKMDTLATLEEACKQVAYLQQLVKSALQLMPHELPQPTPCFPPRCPTDDDVGGGGSGMLGRWTMQHLLERMVNSPPAQAVLCDQEYGVGAATNQQWLLLKQQQEEEEEAASAMRMEMQQQQMWWNLEAPPYQSPV
ncbi:uncharacterized protein LOC130134776 [Syzygium oleosum]|uniref:uncharacterized protein LOC130134776 n=1 Tax=Syzygium oleosum TaxID=219896 RepID=UPI0024BA3464|nr:uncharacterized protein LOC130134776 [Syzygium oleosum]